MKEYFVLKRLYNERAGRWLRPGERWPFEQDQAIVLLEKGIITAELPPPLPGRGPSSDTELEQITEDL